MVLAGRRRLMIRSFLKLYARDPGVKPTPSYQPQLADLKIPRRPNRGPLAARRCRGLRRSPGVESVALTSNLPLQRRCELGLRVARPAPVDVNKRPNCFSSEYKPGRFSGGGVVLCAPAFAIPTGTGPQSVRPSEPALPAKYGQPRSFGTETRLEFLREPGPWLTVGA